MFAAAAQAGATSTYTGQESDFGTLRYVKFPAGPLLPSSSAPAMTADGYNPFAHVAAQHSMNDSATSAVWAALGRVPPPATATSAAAATVATPLLPLGRAHSTGSQNKPRGSGSGGHGGRGGHGGGGAFKGKQQPWDAQNQNTFADEPAVGTGWSVEEMFARNAQV